MRMSDWSSDVCSSDLREFVAAAIARGKENIVECLRCQIAEAEIIGARDRRAGRKTAFAGIECIGDALEISDVGRAVDRGIAAERARDLPAPIVRQLATEAKGAQIGRAHV